MKRATPTHKVLHKHIKELPTHRQLILLGSVLVVASCVFLFLNKENNQTYTNNPPKKINDVTYYVDGTPVTLKNGRAEIVTRTRSIINYFGNEIISDLNGDGMKDIAFILTQSMPRGEVLYYLAVAIYTSTGYVGTNTIFLGDRIAPQTTSVNDREILVNFAERNDGESLTVAPSVGVSRYFIIRNNLVLTEISK